MVAWSCLGIAGYLVYSAQDTFALESGLAAPSIVPGTINATVLDGHNFFSGGNPNGPASSCYQVGQFQFKLEHQCADLLDDSVR